MIIRNLTDKDIPILQSLHDNAFPFPDLESHLYMVRKAALTDEGTLIGAGIVRLTAEAILIMNKDKPQPTRVKATVMLADSMLKETRATGMDECHVFVRDPNVRKFLNRLGFKNSEGGQAMIIHF